MRLRAFAMQKLLVSAIFFQMSQAKAVRKMSFNAVEDEAGRKMVLFLRLGEPESNKALSVLNAIAPKSEAFDFVYVNCKSPEDQPKCDEAGFTELPRWFSNGEHGVESVTNPGETLSEKDALSHMDLMLTKNIKSHDVVDFQDEAHLKALADKLPVLVKFQQPWCKHCKRIKKHFEKASTDQSVAGKAVFVDVDCEKHKAFCKAADISSYPSFRVYSGEAVKTVDQADWTGHIQLARLMSRSQTTEPKEQAQEEHAVNTDFHPTLDSTKAEEDENLEGVGTPIIGGQWGMADRLARMEEAVASVKGQLAALQNEMTIMQRVHAIEGSLAGLLEETKLLKKSLKKDL